MPTNSISILFLLGLAAGQPQAPTYVETNLDATQAVPDNKAAGGVRIDQAGANLSVNADVRMVKPGRYNLQIHEKGDCGDDGAKAGGPLKSGNLGDITVGKDGSGTLKRTVSGLPLNVGSNAVSGKAVVLSQKGKRLACGVLLPPRF